MNYQAAFYILAVGIALFGVYAIGRWDGKRNGYRVGYAEGWRRRDIKGDPYPRSSIARDLANHEI